MCDADNEMDMQMKKRRVLGIGALLAVIAAVARVVIGRRRDAEEDA